MRILGRKDKGFTLAELLIVVAIIGVLVAISIPIFTGQLEKSREAVDAANIRSQYAEVISDALLDGTSVNGKEKYGAVKLKQKQDTWKNTELATNLHSVYAQVKGTPVANGTAWVEYNNSTGQAILHYEGGTGNTTGGSTGGESSGEGSGTTGGNTTGGSGSTGGNTSGSGTGSAGGGTTGGTGTGTNTGSNTSVTFPKFTINHVIPFAVDSSTGITVTRGNVYSYNGRYYVCIADFNAPAGWKSYDYEKITPDGNKWPYIELVNSATVLTNADFKYENSTAPYFQNDSGIPAGTIYKTSDGKVYILSVAYGNSWCTLPSSNSNWVLINQ